MLGILIFAHGSSDPRWRAPVEAVAARVAQLAPASVVACAYLEKVEPDLAAAADAMVGRGVDELRILPLFLGVGRHLREDLPRLVEDLRASHPQLRIVLRNAVGESAEVVDLLARLALAD